MYNNNINIFNMDNLQNIKHILGPISLTELYDGKKCVYIFGDNHKIETRCHHDNNHVHIKEYIEKILFFQKNQKNHIPVHILVEYAFPENYPTKRKTNMKLDCYIHHIFNHLTSDENISHYRNIAQVHSCDVRYFDGYHNPAFEMCLDLTHSFVCDFDNLNKEFHEASYPYYNDHMKKCVNYMKYKLNELIIEYHEKINNIVNFNKLIDELGNDKNIVHNLIQKNIQKIKDHDLREKINDYFLKRIENEQKLLKSIFANNTFQNLLDPKQCFHNYDEYMKFTKDINELLTYYVGMLSSFCDLDAYRMDYYTMARLFKTDSNGNEKTKIIIYAGDSHADTYIDFLKFIGFTQKARVLNDEKSDTFQCIDLTQGNFTIPFFSL